MFDQDEFLCDNGTLKDLEYHKIVTLEIIINFNEKIFNSR